MKDWLWAINGWAHTFFHAGSSFLTSIMSDFNPFVIVFLVILFILISSSWIMVLYQLNKLGINLYQKKSKKNQRLSSGLIKRFGYLGIIFLCLVPFIPWLRTIALLTGQISGLKHTLFTVLIVNAIKLIALSTLTLILIL